MMIAGWHRLVMKGVFAFGSIKLERRILSKRIVCEDEIDRKL